ncbi:hypothetical protein D9758_009049 [Tetrapyrgos nigripes]|uniref:FAD-binding PCMH-type domain-containing protein n=1 Tax=Tetrapyrgos nigripes TaxID=182062 RepID=A0A8H5GA24_9AGAR|nr:hypothetical protein D9758_009049 [Tetrapyrgos nigripes]
MDLWKGLDVLRQKKWTVTFAILNLLSLSSAARSPAQSPGDLACRKLQHALGPSIVNKPNDQDYHSVVFGAWSLFNTQYSPTCVVLPRTSNDVQITMAAIYQYDSKFSVQAGGHSAPKGWNNVDHGVLISFEHMRNISYDSIKDTIVMEPGIRWGESVTLLESQGVAPVGGRVDDVGTGLLLGGGISFLSPAHGFAADNFVELDVVLVDGTLVTATETNEFSDLFRALKGGANRFGIVTRYEVRAIHTGTADDKTWFGGLIQYPPSSFEALAKAISNYTLYATDPNAAILLYFAHFLQPDDTVQSFAIASIFYNGTSLPSSVFGEFLSIPALQTNLSPMSYPEIASSLSEPQPANGHAQMFGAVVIAGGEDDMHVEVLRQWLNFTNVFQDEYNTTVLAFTPIPISQIAIGRERGGNAMNSPLGSAISRLPLYINECDKKQSVFETYGQYEFLKQTYAKYDPTRFNVRRMDGPQGL